MELPGVRLQRKFEIKMYFPFKKSNFSLRTCKPIYEPIIVKRSNITNKEVPWLLFYVLYICVKDQATKSSSI